MDGSEEITGKRGLLFHPLQQPERHLGPAHPILPHGGEWGDDLFTDAAVIKADDGNIPGYVQTVLL